MLSSCKGKPSYLKTGGKSVGIKLKSCNFCFCLYIPVSFTQICFTPVSQVLSFLFYFESFPMYACSKMNLTKPKTDTSAQSVILRSTNYIIHVSCNNFYRTALIPLDDDDGSCATGGGAVDWLGSPFLSFHKKLHLNKIHPLVHLLFSQHIVSADLETSSV